MPEKRFDILLVDDDTGHRAMLRTLLTEWGYGVTEAADGEAAVEQVAARPFDLVLMDVRMPRKTGLEALVEIRAHNPALPVLIMTAFSTIEAAVEAIKTGAYDYLTKPLDFTKLRVTLRNIFNYAALKEENASLLESLDVARTGTHIIGSGSAMQKVLDMVRTVAPSDATVLLTGESGTGKELAAKALHLHSQRKDGPYVAVNCAAITESLLESELFGHEKGAFTGADKRHDGRFMQADKGTLFLDEIGEMPLSMQVKLLRAIQEREVQRVGGARAVPVDVRILAATNRDLLQEVEQGRFREDLYYRLNVVAIRLPPLRERSEDIPLLAQHFLTRFAERNGKSVEGFTPGAMDALLRHTWPGNVRELENIIERSVVLLLGSRVSERELPDHLLQQRPGAAGQTPLTASASRATLEEIERAAILRALERSGGNKSEAAKQLGITRKTLHNKLHRYETNS